MYLINNKNNKINVKKFSIYGESLYNKYTVIGLKKPDKYFKSLYYELVKNLFPQKSEQIFNYSTLLSNGEDFVRSSITTQIIMNKKSFIHKHMIFYSDFDIKRFIQSKHI